LPVPSPLLPRQKELGVPAGFWAGTARGRGGGWASFARIARSFRSGSNHPAVKRMDEQRGASDSDEIADEIQQEIETPR
jgi:hypothetical protein